MIIKFINKHYKNIILLFFIFYFFYLISGFLYIERDYFSLPYFNKDCLSQPILQADYSQHFIEGLEAVSFFKTKGRLWGYNPYYSAGYPSGIFLAVDNHWVFLFNLILGNFLSPPLIFNLAIFFAYLILPIFAFFTARNFKLGKINSLFFSVFSILLIFGIEEIRHFLNSGIYSFVLGVFLSFYVLSLFFKYLFQKNNINLAKLTFFGGLAFFIHPLTAVICLILVIPIFIFYFDNFSFKDFYKLTLSLIIIFLTNLLWLIPFIKFLDIFQSWSQYFQTSLSFFLTSFRDISFIFIFILFLFSLSKLIKNKDYRFGGIIFFSYFIFFILTFFGSWIGFADLQPKRFIIPLLFLSLFSVSRLFEDELKKKNFLFILLILFLSLSFISRPVKFSCGYQNNPVVLEILDFIKKNTTENSRVHIQDGLRESPYFLRSSFSALIPPLTFKESLAAPFREPPTKFKFSQFNSNVIFGKNLYNFPQKEFLEYLNLYNIKYFLIFSEAAKYFFDKYPEFKEVFSQGGYSIYEYLDLKESFCYQCQAEIKADYDKIVVKNSSTSPTILKYHYIKTLKIKPENLKIKPVLLLDDPNPFIMVENGEVADFFIYN